MNNTQCQSDLKTTYDLHGVVRNYLDHITDQWLLVAPLANPAILDMFRDRDAPPLRDMVPWAGEFAGKYLTGAVQVLRVTGDKRLKAWLKEFVGLLIGHQAQDGYLGPWPKNCRLTNAAPYIEIAPNAGNANAVRWDTWGHYHIMLGLLLWHEQTGDRASLKAATRIADLICDKYLGNVTPRLVETGSSETNLAPIHSLCILFKVTGRQRYLDMALQIVDEFSVQGADGAFLGGDYLRQSLAGKEYFETPKPRWESLHAIMGMAELHWITGDRRYRQAFENLWWSMLKGDRHNNGGFTANEHASGNPYSPGPIETCCTIAWLAMSVEMLKLTGNSVVADEIELSTLNSVIGMHSGTGRWTAYNTPSDGHKRASAHHINFQCRPGSPELNCCSVNSPRGFGLISDWAVMRDEQGILLNYFGPSKIIVPMKRGVSVRIEQKTEYPLNGLIDMVISPSQLLPFTLKLRIPHWSEKTTVKLNGKVVKGVKPGRYLAIDRTWKSGDRIQLKLDMSLHVWTGDRECQGRVSLYRGPLLLAFDHRHNLHLTEGAAVQAVQENVWEWFDRNSLPMPSLNAEALHGRRVAWHDWLPPQLLLEFTAADGRKVRLCDFASVGEGGSHFISWLVMNHAPTPVAFSIENPLRSQRIV